MKLQGLKVVYICPNHNEKYKARKKHMDRMLAEIGCTHVEHYVSGAHEHYLIPLVQATVNILRKHIDEPVLILEDDVDFTGIDEFDSPSCDAIYLGLSSLAGHSLENRHEGPSQFEAYSETQARVLNMLGGHAILYTSRPYKETVIQELEKHLGEYNDVHFSRLQSRFLVLANKKPSFYQSTRWNTNIEPEKCSHGVIEIHQGTIEFVGSITESV